MSAHPQPYLHSSVAAEENSCLLTRALAWHYDKHSLWLRVPPKSSRSSSLPPPPPRLVSLPTNGWARCQRCHIYPDSVSTLVSHRSISLTRYTTLFYLSSLFLLRPSPSFLFKHLNQCALICAALFIIEATKTNTTSTLTFSLPLLRVIPVLQLTCDDYNFGKPCNQPSQRGAQALKVSPESTNLRPNFQVSSIFPYYSQHLSHHPLPDHSLVLVVCLFFLFHPPHVLFENPFQQDSSLLALFLYFLCKCYNSCLIWSRCWKVFYDFCEFPLCLTFLPLLSLVSSFHLLVLYPSPSDVFVTFGQTFLPPCISVSILSSPSTYLFKKGFAITIPVPYLSPPYFFFHYLHFYSSSCNSVILFPFPPLPFNSYHSTFLSWLGFFSFLLNYSSTLSAS